jgi:ribose transport system permease protein
MSNGAERRSLRIPTFGFDRFSLLYLWAAFIVAFSLWSPEIFPTMATVHIIASTQAVAGIVALAVLIPLVTGCFDLSVGANANLAGMTAIMLQVNHVTGPIPAILAGIGVGVLVGVVNGFVVVRLHVDSFIATLGMSSILPAIQIIITGNQQPLGVQNSIFSTLTQTKVFGFQSAILYLIVIALFVWWLLDNTPAGRYMRAAGGNGEAARLSGVRVDRWSWIALTLSGTICGIAGVLFVSLSGPSLDFGDSLLLPAFAAVFLGSTQFTPGRANVGGTLLAIFVLATGAQGLQIVSGVQWIAQLFNGVALIVAVALAASRARSKSELKRSGVFRIRGRGTRRGSPETEPKVGELVD